MESVRGHRVTVRVYVSRLRTTLVRAGRPEPIARHPAGYRLVLVPDELDAARFEALLDRSRGRVAAGDRPGALDALDEALALWRGDALDEFADLGFARPEAARLELLRLVAVEDRIEAMLRLGRGAETIGELEALVGRHPDRERPRAQLMKALYAGGRQADALATYQLLRRHLADELGVDPSEATQLVHRRILAHDPALEAAPTQVADNLPRSVTSFVGRGREAAAVIDASRRAPLVTLLGTGGWASPGWRFRWRPSSGPGSRTGCGSPSSLRCRPAGRSRTPSRPRCGCSSAPARRSPGRRSSTCGPGASCS